jgi:hypothetical protein
VAISRVGVDVVCLPGLVGGHNGDHRDVAGSDDRVEHGGVDARHLADEAEGRGIGGWPRGEEASLPIQAGLVFFFSSPCSFKLLAE